MPIDIDEKRDVVRGRAGLANAEPKSKAADIVGICKKGEGGAHRNGAIDRTEGIQRGNEILVLWKREGKERT